MNNRLPSALNPKRNKATVITLNIFSFVVHDGASLLREAVEGNAGWEIISSVW